MPLFVGASESYDTDAWEAYNRKKENTKLRKLVRDMHALTTDHGVYVRYPDCDAWDEKLAVVEKQMRELGVDV